MGIYPGVTVTGAVNSVIQIQACDDLSQTNWTTVSRIALPRSPYVWFDDNQPAAGQRFYRGVLEGTAVTIDTPPSSRTVVAGTNVTLEIRASGSQPFYYQWLWNGECLVGETNSSLYLKNVTQSSSGTYAVAVSNLFGTVYSSNAFLTVAAPPATSDFDITAGSGLNCNIAGGTVVFDDATSVEVPASQVALAPNFTNYLFLDLQDFTFHAFPRAIHSGGIYLGLVVTGTNGAYSISQPREFVLPPNPVETFKTKLSLGFGGSCVISGDSLSVDQSDRLTWSRALFNPPQTNMLFALPSGLGLICDNVAQGGSSSIWSLAMLCSSSVAGVKGDAFPATMTTFLSREIGASLTTPVATGIDSAVLGKSPDLLIVGFGANKDDTYDALALETIVREYTARGCAVIITTENQNQEKAVPLMESPKLVKAIADRYGAAIADTYSYVWEKNVIQGTNTYQDTIHQNQEGHYCWAQAIRSVINDSAQPDGSKNIGLVSRLTANSSTGVFSPSPNWAYVQPAKWRSTGAATDFSGSSNSLAARVCRVPQAEAVQAVAVGRQVYFSFPLASAVYMITELGAGTNINIDVYRDWSHVVNTVTVSGTPNGIQTTRLFNEGDIRLFNNYDSFGYGVGEWRPIGFSLAPKDGTLLLSSIVYLGPKITSISPASVKLGGGNWGSEFWQYNGVPYLQEPMWFCNTTNCTLTIDFHGTGLVVPVTASSSAGTVTALTDGSRIIGYRDMFLSGTSSEVRYYTFYPQTAAGTSPTWATYGDHTIQLLWPTINASAGPSVSGNRLAGIFQSIVAVDTR